MRRKLVFMLGGLLAATPLMAQQPDNDPLAELRRNFTEVSAWASRAAEMVPADKYGFRPAETVRTFGQLIGHLADSYNYYCAVAAGREVEWNDSIEKGVTDKAVLVQRLKQALETCTPVYANGGRFRALVDNLGHTSIHYGNIVTYMRTMGIAPPSAS
jgi:uncharacterized damage-inducible protein DinB